VRRVHTQLGKVIGELDRIYAERGRHGLKFGMSIGYTDRAHVIPFDEQQFHRYPPICVKRAEFVVTDMPS